MINEFSHIIDQLHVHLNRLDTLSVYAKGVGIAADVKELIGFTRERVERLASYKESFSPQRVIVYGQRGSISKHFPVDRELPRFIMYDDVLNEASHNSKDSEGNNVLEYKRAESVYDLDTNPITI